MFGRELVGSMVMQVYDLASSNPLAQEDTSSPNNHTVANILDSLPIGIIMLDKDWNITSINSSASSYLEIPSDKIASKNIHEVLNLSFSSEDTLDNWLKRAQDNRVTDTYSWEHVKLNLDTNRSKPFGLSVHYSKDDINGNEAVITLFEKSSAYSVEEKATSYVSLAVHELRTPLTMLRGYIELFEEEIGDQLDEEHKDFMRKMSATSQNLTAIVSNILNVSRIDENQFTMKLRESDWDKELREIISNLELRAEVRAKTIKLNIDPGLPTVGIDKISIYEVVSNLVDNAIKYSGQSNEIEVTSRMGKDGNIETIVKDKGPGMPENVVSNLFTKFYRSHKSKDTVSGNGLGLYLVKSITAAHGGNVWVSSKVGQGSEFGFSIVPYANLKDEDKSGNNDGIERQANGWIKNHSFYKR